MQLYYNLKRRVRKYLTELDGYMYYADYRYKLYMYKYYKQQNLPLLVSTEY